MRWCAGRDNSPARKHQRFYDAAFFKKKRLLERIDLAPLALPPVAHIFQNFALIQQSSLPQKPDGLYSATGMHSAAFPQISLALIISKEPPVLALSYNGFPGT